jgi:hypothetical protein
MPVACLVVVAPAAGWAARGGSAAEGGAEVPFVVLVPDGNSQIHQFSRVEAPGELVRGFKLIDS